MKSIIRTPKKTLLFILLLMLLAIALNIGVGMYESAQNMMLAADKTFTTVVELDYQGDVTGDEVNFYKNMNADLSDFNFDQLNTHPSVKSVNKEMSAWAYIDDTVKWSNSPLNDFAMIKVRSISKSQDNLYMGVISETIFGKKLRSATYIMINNIDALGNPVDSEFVYDHEYLFIGKVARGRNPIYIMVPGLPDRERDSSAIIDLTANPEFLLSDEGKKMLNLKDAMAIVDSSFPVTTVSSLEASASFYQNEVQLKEGRTFTDAEYKGHGNVILISERLANVYHVTIGDTLGLHLHYDNTGLGLSDYLEDMDYRYEADFEIVGILTNKEGEEYKLYIPEPDWLIQEFHSTTLARYIVENGAGEEFIEDNKSLLLYNMKFTLFDQGYEEAIKPMGALKSNAIMIIVLSSLSGVGILILFSYLYVIKQKDTLKTMLHLGSGKKRTMGYILYGSLSIVLGASGIGSVASKVFLEEVTRKLFESLKSTYITDIRYSERNIGQQIIFDPQVSINPWLSVIVTVAVFILGFILLYFFTYSILKEDKHTSLKKVQKKEKEISPKGIKQNRFSFRGIRPNCLKFALLSLTRSLGRSFIVPIISVLFSVFLIFLGLLSSLQEKKLDQVYEKIPVTAYITSFKNESRDIGGLDLFYDIYNFINPTYYREHNLGRDEYIEDREEVVTRGVNIRREVLETSEYIKDLSLYASIRYEYMGIAKTADGNKLDLSDLPIVRVHNNAFGYDWFLMEITKMPKLVFADNLKYTADYFDQEEPEVEYLEGYNKESLRLKERIGIISQSFADREGIQLGDVIRITSWNNINDNAICSMNDIKVIGIYKNQWETDTIFLPWVISYESRYYVDNSYPTNEAEALANEVWNSYITRRIQAATFTLKNTQELISFRDYLEEQGYSQVGKMGSNRYAIVIQDKSLVETVQNLKNHIRLIDTIKPVLMLLFGFIGFIISYLLIKHRLSELVIMRSLGAKKRQVFLSFFLEQMILFFLGQIPIVVYSIVFPSQVALYGLSLLFLIVSYLVGTAIALIIMNRTKLLGDAQAILSA